MHACAQLHTKWYKCLDRVTVVSRCNTISGRQTRMTTDDIYNIHLLGNLSLITCSCMVSYGRCTYMHVHSLAGSMAISEDTKHANGIYVGTTTTLRVMHGDKMIETVELLQCFNLNTTFGKLSTVVGATY